MKNFIYWTWCLPQTLLGFILKIIYKGKKQNQEGIVYYLWTNESGSISLGKYMLICEGHKNDLETIKHEKGHQIQSFILGPLYLLVIGLPSIIWADFFSKYREKHKISYYSFYTEKWANKLGKVNNSIS